MKNICKWFSPTELREYWTVGKDVSTKYETWEEAMEASIVKLGTETGGRKDDSDKTPGLPNKNPEDRQVGGSHYKTMAIQPSEFIVRNELNWYEGNAVKYICRHHMKNGKQDLEKAIHYLQLAMDYYYPEKEKQDPPEEKELWVDKGIPTDMYADKKLIPEDQPWEKRYLGMLIYRYEDKTKYIWDFSKGQYTPYGRDSYERDSWYHK
jgi:hypothetical protein